MTTLFLRRTGNALWPDGDESIAALMTLPFSKLLKCEVWLPRNVQFHRLYFAMCKRIGDGIGADAEAISTVFKWATGHYELVKTKSYGEVRMTKSISFAKLDEVSFREFFNKCVDVALTEWGIEADALSDLIDPKTEMRG